MLLSSSRSPHGQDDEAAKMVDQKMEKEDQESEESRRLAGE